MTDADWITPIDTMIRQHNAQGGFIIVFPDYRPDQCKALAHALGIRCFDYRQQIMSAQGWDADKIGLDQLSGTLSDLTSKASCLVTNVEALLATKHPDECTAWLKEFVDTPWTRLVLIPITVFAKQVQQDHPRVHLIRDDELPEQSLLNRLAW